jgi:hypothetical protein
MLIEREDKNAGIVIRDFKEPNKYRVEHLQIVLPLRGFFRGVGRSTSEGCVETACCGRLRLRAMGGLSESLTRSITVALPSESSSLSITIGSSNEVPEGTRLLIIFG